MALSLASTTYGAGLERYTTTAPAPRRKCLELTYSDFWIEQTVYQLGALIEHAWSLSSPAQMPQPGAMVQLTGDELVTDELGGQQRVQISLLYFR